MPIPTQKFPPIPPGSDCTLESMRKHGVEVTLQSYLDCRFNTGEIPPLDELDEWGMPDDIQRLLDEHLAVEGDSLI